MQRTADEHDTGDEFMTVTSDRLGEVLRGLPFLLRKSAVDCRTTCLSARSTSPSPTVGALRFAGTDPGPRGASLVIHDATCLRRFLIAG